MIADESRNLELLIRLEKIAHAIGEDPALLTDEVHQGLHSGYEVIDLRYGSGGQTEEMERLGRLGEDVAAFFGIVSGDLIPLSEGYPTSASYGHVTGYLNAEDDIYDALERHTCDLCRPNFIAMIEGDVALGFVRVNDDGRYESVGRGRHELE